MNDTYFVRATYSRLSGYQTLPFKIVFKKSCYAGIIINRTNYLCFFFIYFFYLMLSDNLSDPERNLGYKSKSM